MILFLDTTSFKEVSFAVISDQGVDKKKFKINSRSEKILNFLETFLKVLKIHPKNLEKIYLAVGEGSFSGIRVGAAIALAFSTANDTPIFAIERRKIPKDLKNLERSKAKIFSAGMAVDYGSVPKITKEKKKKLRHT